MPEGTVQDSRDPNSPQWGYLEMEDPPSTGAFLDTGAPSPKKRPRWNRYVMFLHEIQENNSTKRFIRGDRVKFEMRRTIVILPPEGSDLDSFEQSLPEVELRRRVWVTQVTEELP